MASKKGLNFVSLIDLNGNVVPVLPWLGTTHLDFTGVSANLQMPAIPLPVGATTKTGWVVSFTASEDCYIKQGIDNSVTAAGAADDNMFLARGSTFGPIDLKDNDWIACIRHTTSGCLYINRHVYRNE